MSKRIFRFDEPAIGTDGEFFLYNREGEYVSSVGKIGGRKEDPILCAGGGYLEDCVTVEINPDPVPESVGAKVFSNNIQSCIDSVNIHAGKLDLAIDIAPAALFSPEELYSKQASESGCSPSWNVWTNRACEKVDLGVSNYRYASGDLHLSWPEAGINRADMLLKKAIVKYLDIIVGLNEVAFAQPNERARNGYGRLGNHRPTEYGVEYKSISNFWMGTSSGREWAYNLGISAIHKVHNDIDSINSFTSRFIDIVYNVRMFWDANGAKEVLSQGVGEPTFRRV